MWEPRFCCPATPWSATARWSGCRGRTYWRSSRRGQFSNINIAINLKFLWGNESRFPKKNIISEKIESPILFSLFPKVKEAKRFLLFLPICFRPHFLFPFLPSLPPSSYFPRKIERKEKKAGNTLRFPYTISFFPFSFSFLLHFLIGRWGLVCVSREFPFSSYFPLYCFLLCGKSWWVASRA